MSFAGHAKQAEEETKKELPALIAQELSRVVESESAVRIRTFRDKFGGILDTVTLDVLDMKITYLEAEEQTKQQRENQAFCEEQYMAEVRQLMKEYKVSNPIFATISA